MSESWKTKELSVRSLHLDAKNPRLGRETAARSPRDIIQYLFKYDKAIDVARSIATRGFFRNEPLLAVTENDRIIVVEGNRRLAALKTLLEPGLVEPPFRRQIERLANGIVGIDVIKKVPVVLAPNRRATDKQVAGKHVGTPVLPWQAENRASFILDKLNEGYDNESLLQDLGFSGQEIQKAREIRAIADMARSMDLPDEVSAKLDNERTNLFTTLSRVFESTVGRSHLHVELDAEHGIRGTTTKGEFSKAFAKLITDIALGKASSRTLNTNDDIDRYFKSWKPNERAAKKRGSFIPAELISGKSVASATPKTRPNEKNPKQKDVFMTVLPKDLKILYGDERLKDLQKELVRIKRSTYPNAGAVLMRVFLELATINYLKRTGRFDPLVRKLVGKKGNVTKFGTPTFSQMADELKDIVKSSLSTSEANTVLKALANDTNAPFSVGSLHAFVHGPADLPTERDIYSFWVRTQPLFRLMLEQPLKSKTL